MSSTMRQGQISPSRVPLIIILCVIGLESGLIKEFKMERRLVGLCARVRVFENVRRGHRAFGVVSPGKGSLVVIGRVEDIRGEG